MPREVSSPACWAKILLPALIASLASCPFAAGFSVGISATRAFSVAASSFASQLKLGEQL